MTAVQRTRDDARLLESLQPIGQGVGGDPFAGSEKVAVAGLAAQQVTNDQQGPAVAEHVERTGDGAPRALGVASAGGTRLSNLHIASITITLWHMTCFLQVTRGTLCV